MAASVTPGRALRYAGGSARGLLHQALGHYRARACRLQNSDTAPLSVTNARLPAADKMSRRIKCCWSNPVSNEFLSFRS
ncbi:hypothetical protein Ga0080574_TMP1938 [Salipiger abyssi]|uniref:Uncharacterized protein n=1 Tax=Salipiger abyssi TaxID=1250539 RepID=A0A1P8US93_9RHOB|nr:hypothetical protein Ga0080574_TMP1938 [Salipiger abyssi]